MARLSMNEMTTYRWSFDEDVRQYRAAGLAAIGVWRRKLSDFGEERGIELLRESGLEVSNLMWAGGFTGSDGHSYRESLEDASDAIRLAGEMRAKCLVVYSGGRAGHTHNHARRLLCDALKTLAPLAAQHETQLALEPIHPACAAECTFLTSLTDTLAIVDQIAHPSLRLSLDTYHAGHDGTPPALLEKLAPRLAIVHLADGHPPGEEQHRTPLGSGSVRLKEMIAALRSGGYDGDYDVELFGDEIVPADYERLLRESQEQFAKWVGN